MNSLNGDCNIKCVGEEGFEADCFIQTGPMCGRKSKDQMSLRPENGIVPIAPLMCGWILSRIEKECLKPLG